jgi:hypothetical protein
VDATHAEPLAWMLPYMDPAAPAKGTFETISATESEAAQKRAARDDLPIVSSVRPREREIALNIRNSTQEEPSERFTNSSRQG